MVVVTFGLGHPDTNRESHRHAAILVYVMMMMVMVMVMMVIVAAVRVSLRRVCRDSADAAHAAYTRATLALAELLLEFLQKTVTNGRSKYTA